MNDAPNSPKTCACVHSDAYECAKIRDKIVSEKLGRANGYDEDDDYHRRACECSCHDDDDCEPDDS